MDAERWRDEQRALRAAVRAERERHPEDPTPAAPARWSPSASVIVVCWNAADVLGRCLDQLLAQDYPEYEIIVVDDGSQDNTLEIAERAASTGKVTIVRSLANRGCPHARNLGMRKATGEIIAFIDADGYAERDWLTQLVRAFARDPMAGGVASTVFFDCNPMVINGAGGTVNRQGWAADSSMNESYEYADIAPEALYPMGCGMAVRRAAVERVGLFDDRMLNYYDDVDYGIRLGRAGYRVAIVPDAWIDHGFGGSGGDTRRKQLLCERHRMRVVLKHCSVAHLGHWVLHEARAFGRAQEQRRMMKLKAIAWNASHLVSLLMTRWRLRGAAATSGRFIHSSWGDEFPAGVPPISRPRPERATCVVEMSDSRSEEQLLYGWFPVERAAGRSYRWAAPHASALVRLQVPARRLRLDFAHVPVDCGGVDVLIRPSGSTDVIWSTRLRWQYIARSVENHPLVLPPGDYEVLFNARGGWLEAPLETRRLGLALATMSFEETYAIAAAGVDMSCPAVEQQLVNGWFESEQSGEHSYRWSTGRAAILVRVAQDASAARLTYRFPPEPTGRLKISVKSVGADELVRSAALAGADSDWHEEGLPLSLAAGDYVVSFETERTWSNPGQRDPALPPENRSLGFALSSLSFE